MTMLPVVGGDQNTWGGILNAFLEVSLNDDGTIRATGVTPGTYGDATHIPQFIVNAAGQITGVVLIPASGSLNGVIVSGTPTTGEALVATSGTTADWQTVTLGPLTGDVTTSGDVATLQNTAGTEAVIRNIAPNTQAALSGDINANGNIAFTDGLPGVNPGDSYVVGQVGSLIAATYYEPSSAQNKTTTSATLVAIDTTDLTVPFTATTTTAVVVLEAFVGFLAGTAASPVWWALFTHGTTTQVGYSTSVVSVDDNTHLARVRATIRVTGLTVGTSYQYDWAWATNASDTALLEIQATTGAAGGGPAIMQVYAG